MPIPPAFHGVVHARRFLYYLSYIKVAVAMAMYLPQVLLNHERRSTAGFSIEQVGSGELLCPCKGIEQVHGVVHAGIVAPRDCLHASQVVE